MDRSTWSVYQNFVDMYDGLYEAMEEAGVAEKLDDSVWLDEEGNDTEKNKALGRQATHYLIHPDCVIFIDEVSCCNMSQEGDRHVGSELLTVE